MKKIYLCLIFLALISCARVEVDRSSAGQPLDLSVVFQTKAGGDDGAAEMPVVNSMRVLIFYGEDTAEGKVEGEYLMNEFYAFGFNTDRPSSDKSRVSLANPVTLPQSSCRKYSVYVVLNEEGFLLSGSGDDLNRTLGEFEGSESSLRSILGTTVTYPEVIKNAAEPAFLISGSKTVELLNSELGKVKPVTINADTDPSTDGFNRGRSLAQIIVDRITSEPADGIDYSSNEVPLIFVKSVTLENIPDAIAWAEGDGVLGGSSLTAGIGEAKTHEDGEYYDRVWYGQVTRTISRARAVQTQYTDAKLYRTADSKQKTEWSFTVKPYESAAPFVFTTYKAASDNKAQWDNSTRDLLTKNDGSQLPQLFAAMMDDIPDTPANITNTSYEISSVKGDGGDRTTIGPMECSDEYWTVRLGDQFYVPENIQNTAADATYIRIKLAIADPIFSFRLNNDTGKRVGTEDGTGLSDKNWQSSLPQVSLSDLPSPATLDGTLTYTYYLNDNGNLVDINDKTKSHLKIGWADDESHTVTADDKHGQYHVYMEGFMRKSNEVTAGDIVVNEKLKGAKFGWNVPDTDGASTHVFEYLIPVNNNIDKDGDYSVRRNTRYTVTLHVNQDTYDSLVTKSGESAPFTVTAKVRTERLSDYE